MENEAKVVVITGASSGIGRATALEFARREYCLVLGARRENALYALAEECKRLGGKALVFPLDVTYENDVYALAEKAKQEFGKIDVWVNNAAVSALGRFEDIPTEEIRRVIDINVLGYIYGARAAITHFKQRKEGLLVNVSSIVGITGQPYSLPYTVSKFAIRGLSATLQQELSDEKNIHVCTVLPGTIDTPLYQQAANYMGLEVQAPGPALDADEVAVAIASLVENPRKELVIGRFGRTSAYLSRLFVPEVFDRQMRKMILKSHFTKEPSYPSKGNLYEPMREYSSISGGWQHERNKESGRKVAVGIAATGAVVGAALAGRAAIRKREAEKLKRKTSEQAGS